MRPIRSIPTLLITATLCLEAQANNLTVRNVALIDPDPALKQLTVSFDMGWENSWRNDVNHDAAWVFVKFRAAGSNHWQHAYLSETAGDHTAPDGVVALATGVSGDTERVVGAFVFSASNQTGTVQYARTRLRWDYGASGYDWPAGQPVEVSVHAIEMVYVPQGPFYLGTGGTESGSFTEGGWTSGTAFPFRVTGEAALAVRNEPGSLWGTSASGNNTIGPVGELPAAFPKGFQAFYCMKYSLTQGQYAGFLNRLTAVQAATVYPGQYGNYRHTIWFEDGVYRAGAPDRACNFLRWRDGLAYAQWAGLRPMTELEYEKACRGAADPVPNEWAWGTAAGTLMSGVSGEDGGGEETALPVNANYTKSSDMGGPVRAGIFATDHADRVSAGASFWGIMDLSSHPCELIVSVAVARGRAFEGSHGNGTLSPTGNATQSDWPGFSTTSGEVTGTLGAGIRVSNVNDPRVIRQVSDRIYVTAVNGTAYSHYGWRGVRTAP